MNDSEPSETLRVGSWPNRRCFEFEGIGGIASGSARQYEKIACSHLWWHKISVSSVLSNLVPVDELLGINNSAAAAATDKIRGGLFLRAPDVDLGRYSQVASAPLAAASKARPPRLGTPAFRKRPETYTFTVCSER